jgi:hypothetical protein
MAGDSLQGVGERGGDGRAAVSGRIWMRAYAEHMAGDAAFLDLVPAEQAMAASRGQRKSKRERETERHSERWMRGG